MAKRSSIERNNRVRKTVARQAAKRAALKATARDATVPMEERFAARLALAALPRDGSPTRVRNRCLLSGRPRGYHRKLMMSRIALRELASVGQIPGMVKASW